jgi:hypothetical protein
MPRATTNKSMRLDEPQKEMRRRSVDEGETDENNRIPGASGDTHRTRKRPGRAASLLGTSQRTRSQRSRNPEKGSGSKRRDVVAQGSRTSGRQSSK